MSFFEDIKAAKMIGGGGGTPAPTLITKSITTNGSYSASDDSADGYSAVSVDVANTYGAGDEGKVVSNGALVSQSSSSTSSNGTVDTTLINSLAISVPTYSAADNGKVIQNGALAAQLTHKSITANGTGIDTTYYSSVDVAVANSYSAGDEGKVVSNGALVAQGSDTVTQNGTVDTTLISSLVVNVPTAGQITSLVKLEPYQNNCVSDLYIGTMITSGVECWFLIGSIELLTTPYSYLYLTVPSTFDTSKINYIDRLGTSKIYGSSVSSLSWIQVNYDSTNQRLAINFSGSGYFVSGNKYSITGMNAV